MASFHPTVGAILFAGSFLVATPAHAQDALGAGNALDANTSDRGTSNSARSTRQVDYRLNNLVVTQDVTAGRGFRGAVGYVAAEDFRVEDPIASLPGGNAPLGSDVFMPFARDAAWSDVNLINFGTTYQQIRFGQDMGMVEYRRPSTGATALDIGGTSPDIGSQVYLRPDQMMQARIRLDRITEASSLSNRSSRTGASNMPLGMIEPAEGSPRFITGSSLTGIGMYPIDQYAERLGLTPFDSARVILDARVGALTGRVGEPFMAQAIDLLPTAPEDMAGRADASPMRETGRVDLQETPEYREIVERVALRYAEQMGAPETADPALLGELDNDLRRLREELSGRRDPAHTQDEAPRDIDRGGAGSEDGGDGEDGEDEADDGELDLGDIGTYLRHGEQIDRLATDDRSRFNELLQSGEERLREGEYFWAERHFNRALRFKPGHPMATAGLAHSQLGAGLYLSAALTVRSLFSYQPEMIDATYAPELIPNRPALTDAQQSLGARLDQPTDQALNGLLYAYVSRLLGDRAGIERGLQAMESAEPNDQMIPLLRKIWLS